MLPPNKPPEGATIDVCLNKPGWAGCADGAPNNDYCVFKVGAGYCGFAYVPKTPPGV